MRWVGFEPTNSYETGSEPGAFDLAGQPSHIRTYLEMSGEPTYKTIIGFKRSSKFNLVYRVHGFNIMAVEEIAIIGL